MWYWIGQLAWHLEVRDAREIIASDLRPRTCSAMRTPFWAYLP
jgi:hypothetical protein